MSGLHFGAIYGIQGSSPNVSRAVDVLKASTQEKYGTLKGTFAERTASYDGITVAIVATSRDDVAEFNRSVGELRDTDKKAGDAGIIAGIKRGLLRSGYQSKGASEIDSGTKV